MMMMMVMIMMMMMRMMMIPMIMIMIFMDVQAREKVGAQASENRGVQASGRPTSARSRISHESITAPSSNLREHKLCGCCTAAQSTKCCIVALTWSLQNAGLRVVLKATRVSAVYAHQGIG